MGVRTAAERIDQAIHAAREQIEVAIAGGPVGRERDRIEVGAHRAKAAAVIEHRFHHSAKNWFRSPTSGM